MSGWQYGEHILAIYDCEQGFPLMFGENLNLWKTLLEHRRLHFFEDTFRSIIHVEHRWILKATVNRPISSREVFVHTIPFPGRDRRTLPQEVQWQISLPSLWYCQSNKPIILICVFVKISTNPSPKVRSWPWRLHESEIRVQGNQRFSFLVASCRSQAAGEKSRKTTGTRVYTWKLLKDARYLMKSRFL